MEGEEEEEKGKEACYYAMLRSKAPRPFQNTLTHKGSIQRRGEGAINITPNYPSLDSKRVPFAVSYVQYSTLYSRALSSSLLCRTICSDLQSTAPLILTSPQT